MHLYAPAEALGGCTYGGGWRGCEKGVLWARVVVSVGGGVGVSEGEGVDECLWRRVAMGAPVIVCGRGAASVGRAWFHEESSGISISTRRCTSPSAPPVSPASRRLLAPACLAARAARRSGAGLSMDAYGCAASCA